MNARLGNCLGCGKDGNKVRDFPLIKYIGNKGVQAQEQVLVLMLLKRITSMLSALGVTKKNLLMSLVACCKCSPLMYII